MIVSDAYWRTQLGADSAIVGRTLKLDGVEHTVVGVMPRDFQYVRPYDLFTSMGPVAGTPNLLDRGNHNGFYALGRLKPGVSLEAAGSELKAIAAALEREYPNTNSAVGVRAELLADRLVDDIRLTLLALLGAVGFLLLIACVNVANLLIARGASRQHELAVRAALGGGRVRLASQMLVESTLVSVAGGVLGVGVAAWLLRGLVAVAPEGTPRIAEVHARRHGAAVRAGRRGDLRRRVRRAAGISGIRRPRSAGARARRDRRDLPRARTGCAAG